MKGSAFAYYDGNVIVHADQVSYRMFEDILKKAISKGNKEILVLLKGESVFLKSAPFRFREFYTRGVKVRITWENAPEPLETDIIEMARIVVSHAVEDICHYLNVDMLEKLHIYLGGGVPMYTSKPQNLARSVKALAENFLQNYKAV